MKSIYRCSACGEWFNGITIVGDYTPGEFGPIQFCESDLKQLDEDMKFLDEREAQYDRF